MSLQFAVEPLNNFLLEGQELFRQNFVEASSDVERVRPTLAVDYYRALDSGGFLVITTARKSGLLVGYFVLLLSPHPHYNNTLCAVEDAYFLHPSARKAGKGLLSAGQQLIRFAMEEAKKRGAVKFVAMAPRGRGKVLQRLGMLHVNDLYSIWLGE